MNRRELLTGLAASLTAAKIPVSLQALHNASNGSLTAFLFRVREDLINRIINPPYVLHENGCLEQLSNENAREALAIVNNRLSELLP